ncbi:Nucleolar GTP-binding protein 1, partial [Coemansia sp. RSA 1853]
MPNERVSLNGGVADKTLRRVSQFHRHTTAQETSGLWKGISAHPTLHSNNAKCDKLMGHVTMPINIPQNERPKHDAPDSAVLDRMQELESTIALVKSSLDNHATSYYSVASQIAELNARVGRLGVHDRSGLGASTADEPVAANDASTHSVDVSAAYVPDTRDDDVGDEQYTRIQQMIDSLIKDAGSALSSTPDDSVTRACGFPANRLDEPKLLATVPEFQRSLRPGSASRMLHSAPRPKSRAREYSPHAAPAFRPTSRSSRSRKLNPMVLKPELDDPSEADGESDSEHSTFSVTGYQARRNLYRPPRPSSSRSRRRSSGHTSDWRTPQLDRYRSDTMDSHLSNSSETCVSPGNRVSREMYCLPADPACTADSMFVSARTREFGDCGASSLPACGMHDFPHLDVDSGPPSNVYRRQGTSRTAHRAATFVNESDGAGSRVYRGRLPGWQVQNARRRSNTCVSEALLAADGYFDGVVQRQESPTRKRNDTLRDLDWRQHGREPKTDLLQLNYIESSNEKSLTVINGNGDDRQCTRSVGLLSVVSLLYWTLLFTLGALMLDSFVCQVAGKRVMGTVDRIAHTDNDAADLSDDAGYSSSQGKQSTHPGLTHTVGRFVRWCVEDPETSLLPPLRTRKSFKPRIAPVPDATDFLDIVLSKTQRKTPTVVHPGYKITRIRQFYMRKVKFTQDTFDEKLRQILEEFPVLDN